MSFRMKKKNKTVVPADSASVQAPVELLPNRAQKRAKIRAEKLAEKPGKPQTRKTKKSLPVRASVWRSGMKRRKRADKLGLYEPSAPAIETSTRQAEALHIAVAGSPTSHRGLLLGVDTASGWMIARDPFTNYNEDGLTSPNVCVVGALGNGKSSMLKTWGCLRNLTLGRRVVIIDKKPQFFASLREKRGEYTALAYKLGVRPIRFTLDGTGTKINILDPRIAARVGEDSGATAARTPAGQSQLLRVILAEALGRPISPKEGKALRVAHTSALALAEKERRQAILPDIVDFLYRPDAGHAERSRVSVEDLKAWGQDPVYELERMIEEDLQGIVDGPTSEWVDLGSGLTVFDVSALPEDGPALAIVMMIINTWLSNVLSHQSVQIPTILIVEEAWHLVQGSYAAVTRRNTKLSRGLGLSCMFAFHHISDIPKDSPALAMLSECGMKLLYGQDTDDDSKAVVQLFRLPSGSEDLLDELDQGEFVFKFGSSEPIRCLHVRSDLEIELTNSDDAMLSTGQIEWNEEVPEQDDEVGEAA